MIRPPEPEDLQAFAQRVLNQLDELGIPYAICGSMAAMEYSEPRLSIDIDLMIMADPKTLARLVAAVEQWGMYVTPIDVILEQISRSDQPFNIIDGLSGSKADIYIVSRSGISAEAMDRRRSRVWQAGSGQSAWFLSPEDIILYKLRYFRRGGEVSRKHPTDIAKMLAVIGDDLDLAYMERWAAQLGVLDLWQEVWRQHTMRE